MAAQTVDDKGNTEHPQPIGVFWRILGWAFAASIVGGILYSVILVLLVTVWRWGQMGDLGTYLLNLLFVMIFGAVLGAYFGFLLALANAIVLALLIRTRIMHPHIYRWHRISSLIVAVPVLMWSLSGFLHPIMSSFKPDVRNQFLPVTSIDTSKIHISLQQALLRNGIKTFHNFSS